ncbi:RelE/StbE family addiction module toxin [Bacteroidia bacterium]|nr:RelE/StbE family addiction module toxin [Bacteroidia bacterium]
MYQLKTSNKYDKEYVLASKRGLDISLLDEVVMQLVKGNVLDARYKNHKLSGDYEGCYECHIKPDWLLIYRKNETDLVLLLMRTGTHSDLF